MSIFLAVQSYKQNSHKTPPPNFLDVISRVIVCFKKELFARPLGRPRREQYLRLRKQVRIEIYKQDIRQYRLMPLTCVKHSTSDSPVTTK